MHRYKVHNDAMATTAALRKVATGTAVRTMLQISTPSTRQMVPISWGFSLDAPPTATGRVELIQTDVAATALTAHVAAGLQPLDPNAPASLMTLGTGNTGYMVAGGSAPTEGTTTASRTLDQKEIPIGASATGTTGTDLTYEHVFTQAERWIIAVSKFLRVRATFGGSVNMLCWLVWDE